MARFMFVDRLGAHSIWRLMDPIAITLLKQGHDVAYCRMDDGQQRASLEIPTGVDCFDLDVPHSKNAFSFAYQQGVWCKKFWAIVKNWKPEVVHTNFVVPGAFSILVAKQFHSNIKVITTNHENVQSMNPALKMITKLTSHFVDNLVYISETVATSYGKNCSSPTGSIKNSIIYNGIELSELNRYLKKQCIDNPQRIVCIGRMVPVKGQSILLDALPALLRNYPTVELVFAGTGPDEAALKQQARALGIEKQVSFAGWLPRDKTLELMASANALVVPSDGSQEGFGLVVAEAMALGVPVLCSDIPVFREVAEDTAAFFKTGDANDLAKQLNALFLSPDCALERIEKAKTRVHKHFDVTAMVQSYLDLYLTVLS